MHVDNRTIGNLGEDIAARWLLNNGHTIITRNYRIPYGEIDIITRKGSVVHYIEVKTIQESPDVSRETYAPWNNLTKQKVSSVISTAHYHRKAERMYGYYQIDAMSVVLNINTKRAVVQYMENINI
jgi:putative endonuclease